MPGIEEVTGELATGRLIVTYDSAKVSPDQMAEEVEEAGFSVKERFTP